MPRPVGKEEPIPLTTNAPDSPDTAEEDLVAQEIASRAPWLRRLILLIAMLLVVALLVIWSQRRPIAEHFVEQQLAARNVRATYDVKQIALRTQRIENLVLGDPG